MMPDGDRYDTDSSADRMTIIRRLLEPNGSEDTDVDLDSRPHTAGGQLYALLAICLMSVGSHFLNSTWTPIVAGFLVSKLGTAKSSILFTGLILVGQLITFFGVASSSLEVMALGLFTFGLSFYPLSVLQETLLSRLSSAKSLGISLALGLLSGKSSAFIASLVSLPLAERYGDATPFALGMLLCGMSFGVNIMRLAQGWAEEKSEIVTSGGHGIGGEGRTGVIGILVLGDVYWVYILLNALGGAIWSPLIHLSSNLFQMRYGESEEYAASQASVLLAGAIVMYPIVGYVVDRFAPSSPTTTFRLLLLSSLFTLFAYTYLSLPPSLTRSPWPAISSYMIGYGSATLLMVILVPRILPPVLVPYGLGVHKSMEMASTSLSQTMAGAWLDYADKRPSKTPGGERPKGGGALLRMAVLFNALHLLCAVTLWRFEANRRGKTDSEEVDSGATYEQLPMNDLPRRSLESDSASEDGGEVGSKAKVGLVNEARLPTLSPTSGMAKSEGELRRTVIAGSASLGFVLQTWLVVVLVGINDLRG